MKLIKRILKKAISETFPLNPNRSISTIKKVEKVSSEMSMKTLGAKGANRVALYRALEIACNFKPDPLENKKVYLAAPYTHRSTKIMDSRADQIAKKTAELMNEGMLIYSPITSTHQLAKDFKMPQDFIFWQELNHSLIDWAHEVWVFRITGWEKSKGVADEIKYAIETGKPINYID